MSDSFSKIFAINLPLVRFTYTSTLTVKLILPVCSTLTGNGLSSVTVYVWTPISFWSYLILVNTISPGSPSFAATFLPVATGSCPLPSFTVNVNSSSDMLRPVRVLLPFSVMLVLPRYVFVQFSAVVAVSLPVTVIRWLAASYPTVTVTVFPAGVSLFTPGTSPLSVIVYT